jgi:hypothetical protein
VAGAKGRCKWPDAALSIERCDAGIESGAVKPIPYDQPMREIRRTLGTDF